ncbi:MAG TPA: hypothetical protein VF006_13895 [Longimicrobium sp.]
MASITTRIRNAAFGIGILAALGSGASAARAEVARSIILDSAEECREYCTYMNKPFSSWDPNTGACRCW